MSMLRRGLRLSLTLAVTLAAAPPAHAHLMNTGFGPFYDGLMHPFVTPEDLLPVVALTLLAGLRGARCGRWVLFTLPAAWLAGMTGGLVIVPHGSVAWLTCGLTIALGALVAADWKVPLPVVIGGAVLLGLTHGWVNGAGARPAPSGALGMAGVASALFVVVALLAGPVVTLQAAWGRVVVRVAGSWMAAIGLLMLGWTVRAAGG
jgi:hydrogenase/urease accessory protein HupE